MEKADSSQDKQEKAFFHLSLQIGLEYNFPVNTFDSLVTNQMIS
jgi:hypothetical protein